MNIKAVTYKDEIQIAKEWDEISIKREALIKSGKDISFEHVLLPSVLKNMKNCNQDFVLDCGCGTGILTNILSKNAKKIVGIDISSKSIEVAKNNNAEQNIIFYNNSINEFAELYPQKISTCIANMFLMDALNLNDALKSIHRMLVNDGVFIATITHPCFWPIYWGYFQEEWFNYEKEIIIESDFKTTFADKLGTSTHIHRPLNMYAESMVNNGFKILHIEEPYPNHTIVDYKFDYPRFLLFKCQKTEF